MNSEADFNLVKSELDSDQKTLEDLVSEEINLKSELEQMEQEISDVNAEAEVLRNQVKVNSDKEFTQFQLRIAPLIKRNLIVKRSAFNIAMKKSERDADIVLLG